jgi:hypothetical protein
VVGVDPLAAATQPVQQTQPQQTQPQQTQPQPVHETPSWAPPGGAPPTSSAAAAATAATGGPAAAPPGSIFPGEIQPTGPARSNKRRNLFIALGLLVVVALGAAAAIVLTRGGDDGGNAVGTIHNGSEQFGAVVQQSPAVATTAMNAAIRSPEGVRVEIPAGAVPLDMAGEVGEITVSIDQVVDPAEIPPADVSGPSELGQRVYKFGPEGQVFETPVRITLPIPEDLGDAKVGGVAYFDQRSGKWVLVPSEVREDKGEVQAFVTHFSLYGFWITPSEAAAQRDQYLRDNFGTIEVHVQGTNGRPWPADFFGRPARFATGSEMFGVCIEQFNLVDPSLEDTIPDQEFFSAMNHPDWDSANPAVFHWPAGTYQVLEVASFSEINWGDPLTLPNAGFAYRSIGTVEITAGSTRQFRSNGPDASSGWIEGRPSCARTPNPSLGTGDVQVTLNWPETGIDLDLHVIEPSGEEIYFAADTSSSGGQLDSDNLDGGGVPENIFWGPGGAPSGEYQVAVVYYSGDGPATWSIRIIADGRVQNFSGTITADDDRIEVATFSVG